MSTIQKSYRRRNRRIAVTTGFITLVALILILTTSGSHDEPDGGTPGARTKTVEAQKVFESLGFVTSAVSEKAFTCPDSPLQRREYVVSTTVGDDDTDRAIVAMQALIPQSAKAADPGVWVQGSDENATYSLTLTPRDPATLVDVTFTASTDC